jgi:hypothetical protein
MTQPEDSDSSAEVKTGEAVQSSYNKLCETVYPAPLREAEKKLYQQRPKWHEKANAQPESLGFGLSGGGIRSATFCLGVFQGLAKLRLLGHIDYISSVSGGSYFASFYGRLFTRPDISGVAEIEQILSPNEKDRMTANEPPADLKLNKEQSAEFRRNNAWKTAIFDWMRDNGRFLAPKGGGDLLLGIAVALRNLLTVQLMIAVSVMTILLTAQFLRVMLEMGLSMARTAPSGRCYIWWSPYLVVGLAMVLFLVVPPGAAYWMFHLPEAAPQDESGAAGGLMKKVTKWNRLCRTGHLVSTAAILAMLMFFTAAGLLAGAQAGYEYWGAIIGFVYLFAVLAFAFWAARVKFPPHRRMTQSGAQTASNARLSSPAVDERDKDIVSLEDQLVRCDQARNWLSATLRTGLVATLAMLAFGLIDSVGQMLYARHFWPDGHPAQWLGRIYGALLAAAPFAHWVTGSLFGNKKPPHLPISLSLLAGAGAALVIVPALLGLDMFSHAIAYGFQNPTAAPPLKAASVMLGAALVFAALFSYFAGGGRKGTASGAMVFLNRTSLHSLYTARLIRAYLGASNKSRHRDTIGVAEVVSGDDISQERYWIEPQKAFYCHGAPLHIMNVTVNETIDGDSQIEQRDRKGLGMAVGLAGLSVGVRHHAVYQEFKNLQIKVETFPHPAAGEFRVFDYEDQGGNNDNIADFKGERPSLGNWTGMSGAAAATGMGYRTSLGVSLLTAFFNVRLGYWWDSGIASRTLSKKTPKKKWSKQFGNWLSTWLPLQSYLIDEFLSRFHGTARRLWYLSDGGNFENLGGYELIRRRLSFMIVIDAGADPNYDFDDLAGLVRKARLDFNAEIEFLNPDEIKEELKTRRAINFSDGALKWYGPLEQLRRGKRADEPSPVAKGERNIYFKSANTTRYSLKHAALARVNYLDDPTRESLMLLIKPTLVGDEPADVLQYHSSHPAFPHESTADQFFDEAQWEAYRRLGQHIVGKLFATGDQGGFFPGELLNN